ncbi:hypothetical protein [Streptomyces sp. TP-A0356]|uniref:hypothetical protein n=1 Tax=Streptomyces sp. TP-A0356 TaxID=1359208 RepID=UPI000B11BAAA|nr:hypothetical protein [Streptomyces sp. TP-A0356]
MHLGCERGTETHLQALLLQAQAVFGLAPIGLRARYEDDGQLASLRATINHHQVGAALEQVISCLSLEPGVRDLHWHLDDAVESDRHRHQVLI